MSIFNKYISAILFHSHQYLPQSLVDIKEKRKYTVNHKFIILTICIVTY